MGVKSKLKKLVGRKGIRRIRAMKAQLGYLRTRRNAGCLRLLSPEWEAPAVFSLPDKHVFFGYYDIPQLQDDKLLLTAVSRKADPRKDAAQLYWVDISTGEYHKIGQTRAWCWQQGARLRWHPALESTVLYNDLEDGHYVCRLHSLENGRISTMPRALYDLTPDGRWGLSLNYSRLQRLRPGYGYGVLPDATEGRCAPRDDGIFLVDAQSGESRLVVSYERLVELCPEAAEQQNYVNHISVSPDGSRFLFFHLWTSGVGQRWNGRLYTVRLDGSELRCVEKEFIPSHYCWNGPDRLLITSVGFGGSHSYYYLYDLTARTRQQLPGQELVRDGHPTCFGDGTRFVADTYPMDGAMQRLFTADLAGNCEPICQLYSDPRLFDEQRCDLHPRITPDGGTITVDSTLREGKRAVVLLQHK